MKKLPKIGQRVVVKDTYTWDDEFDVECHNVIWQIGTVVKLNEGCSAGLEVLVEFDIRFNDDLHKGKGPAKGGKCWWLNKTHLRKVK